MEQKNSVIVGVVKEVRINGNSVILFVQASSPKKIVGKIVRFHIISSFNDATCPADDVDWCDLAVSDVVSITRICASSICASIGTHIDYKLKVVHSEVLDADNDL